MDDDETLGFHEKLYFHELDSRERLIARLQLTLAILTGLVGVWTYIVYRLDFRVHPAPFVHALFVVSFVIGTGLVATACFKFVKALWGHSYECLPVPVEIEKYRITLYETYKDFSDGATMAADYYRKFLIRYFSECATHNAVQNSQRYDNLHESVSYIVCSVPFIFIAALTFVLGGLGRPTP